MTFLPRTVLALILPAVLGTASVLAHGADFQLKLLATRDDKPLQGELSGGKADGRLADFAEEQRQAMERGQTFRFAFQGQPGAALRLATLELRQADTDLAVYLVYRWDPKALEAPVLSVLGPAETWRRLRAELEQAEVRIMALGPDGLESEPLPEALLAERKADPGGEQGGV